MRSDFAQRSEIAFAQGALASRRFLLVFGQETLTWHNCAAGWATLLVLLSTVSLLTASQGQFVSRALFPFDGERNVEFYELRMAPLHREMAEAHPAGTRENLIVAEGVFRSQSGPTSR